MSDLGGERVDRLPFSAVVGLEDAKLALILAAVDRRIGGVLLRGDKGSAKSTLARGLASLLPGDAPFVELPIGATEDRLIGTLDITAALTGGDKRFEPGLLAEADGGVLYVDEVNLLPDHLVDVLLDVAASGVNRVEREGVSHAHASRFVLVGSMNPEEGELRPQLLDRFGLAVDVRTSPDPATRAAAVRRRLEFDAAPDEVSAAYRDEESELALRLDSATSATVPDALVDAVSALCDSVGAEGLRADLTICRAAAALSGWEGREEATASDVRRVAQLALAHRARRDPFDPTGVEQEALSNAMDQHLDPQPREGGRTEDESRSDPGPASNVSAMAAARDRTQSAPAAGRRTPAQARRGRFVGDRPPDGPIGSVAVGATVRRAAQRVAADSPEDGPLVRPTDLREAVREQKSANLIVIAVDASGSMGAERRMESAKGTVLGLLRDAYVRRDLVSLVAFRGDTAQVLLRPTGSVEVAKARLAKLPTGGRTPLAAGIRAALDIARSPARAATHRPFIVVITDGRATAAPGDTDPVEAAASAALAVRREGIDSVVVDVEAGELRGTRLGLAASLAAQMGARHLTIGDLTSAELERSVRQAVGARK
jgi:magnesium chelatase subunit D